jgi:hypothetical protein
MKIIKKNNLLAIFLFISLQAQATLYYAENYNEIAPIDKDQQWNIIKADDNWIRVLAFIELSDDGLNCWDVTFKLQEDTIIDNKLFYKGEYIKMGITGEYFIDSQQTEIAYHRTNPLLIFFRYKLT